MTILVYAMNNYSSLRNLSVVEHNQMLVMRSNPKTETARIKALDLLLVEMEARRNYQMALPLSSKALRIASGKTNKALQSFFKAKDKDNGFEPTFKVVA
jgi:purine-nucleoside phosphorylase